MGSKYKAVKISEKLYDYVKEEVQKEFLKHHPEFKGMPLSFNFLMDKAARYYVENWT